MIVSALNSPRVEAYPMVRNHDCKVESIQPFYFRTYDKIIGQAKNLNKFQVEITRLAIENSGGASISLERESHSSVSELLERERSCRTIERSGER